MAEVANTLRYRLGLVNVTNNSTTVTGVGTHWATAGINPGATFKLDGMAFDLEVKRVVSDTEIELVKPFYGSTAASLSYSVERNFNSTLPAKIAADVTDLVGIYEQLRDGTVLTIEGKSAYQVAVANGYSGTEAQWLESLKGAGDYTALRTELVPFRHNDAGTHNAYYYPANLGVALTDAQSSAIRNGTFTGMYPGGNWTIAVPAYSWTDSSGTTHSETASSQTFEIAGCDTRWNIGDSGYELRTHHLEMVPRTVLFDAPMNATNTTAGGYVGSAMFTNYLRRAEALIKAAFGEDHILSHREYLCNAVSDGKPSGAAWYTRTVDLMTEQMVYGARCFGPANDGGSSVPHLLTANKIQLPLFLYRPEKANSWFGLRDVVNSNCFASVYGDGRTAFNNASTSIGVRPSFLIY